MAVRDVTLEIADGELLVLVGPSGSGKSTVLRLIAGLETPTAGRILIDGRDVTDVPPQRRDLAMVFQSYALYPHKTVRENLAFGLRVRHVDAAQIDERVRATAAALGIEALLDRKPAQLSGGQRQRVALGRAIVREPKAFLLDEPLSNLDPLLRVGDARRAGAAAPAAGRDDGLRHARSGRGDDARHARRRHARRDRRAGRAAARGVSTAGQCVRRRFVGSPAMNLWPGTVHRAGDGAARCLAGLLDRAGRPLMSRLPDGGEVWVGVRPHDIDLVPRGDGDGAGRVEIVEPLGPSTLIHLRVDGLPHRVRARRRHPAMPRSRWAIEWASASGAIASACSTAGRNGVSWTAGTRLEVDGNKRLSWPTALNRVSGHFQMAVSPASVYRQPVFPGVLVGAGVAAEGAGALSAVTGSPGRKARCPK